MPRFSINVSFMLEEFTFLDRFQVAADFGFTGVDIQFPYDHPPEVIASRARTAGVEVVLHNLPAGDSEASELGIAGLPGREAEFQAGVEQALTYSRALSNERVNILAGRRPPDVSPEICHEVLIGNLRRAAESFANEGITVMVEPANGRDVPDYLLQTTEAALAAIDQAGGQNLAVQFDLYHRQIMQGDLIPALERHLPRIGHIQFADTPGRHEPGSGEINFERVFAAIDELDYNNWVGAEYKPRRTTADSLAWFEPWRDRQGDL